MVQTVKNSGEGPNHPVCVWGGPKVKDSVYPSFFVFVCLLLLFFTYVHYVIPGKTLDY